MSSQHISQNISILHVNLLIQYARLVAVLSSSVSMASGDGRVLSTVGQAKSSSSFHFIAGLSTGVLSASLLQPADLLKTRVQQSGSASLLQIIQEISQSPHSFRQLWRGTLPSVIRTGFGSALYFSTLNALRQHVARSNILTSTGFVTVPNGGPNHSSSSSSSSSSLPRLSNMANLSTGATARASAGFIMMPITVIKVRFESSIYSYGSIRSAGTAILKSEGIKGFFSGFGATAMRDAPYAGLYVLFYEQSKRRLSQLQDAAPTAQSLGLQRSSNSSSSSSSSSSMRSGKSAPINFISSIIAAGLATTMTNPFDAVKTRLQLMPDRYANLLSATQTMIREDGLRTFFDGLAIRVGRKAISSALAWTLYEELIRRAELRWDEKSERLSGL